MKSQSRPIARMLMFISAAAVCLSCANAQLTYVSNLAESPFASIFGYNAQWLGQSFTTGPNADGYLFDSTTLALTAPGASIYTISLFSNNADKPGAALSALNDDGGFVFSQTGITLAPSTTYWVVLSTAEPFNASTSPIWSIANSGGTPLDGWTMESFNRVSSPNSGASWTNSGGLFQLSVSATAVPEPSTCGLLTLAAAGAMALARRRK